MNAAAVARSHAVRVGHGSAYGAVSILNATATGIGCSLAVALRCEATWTWRGSGFEAQTPGSDDRLAQAVWRRLRGISPHDGAQISTKCAMPPARGLKTSSSAAGALVRAAFDAAGEPADWTRVAHEAVEASIAAGVTLTGAFDDQVACLRGGAHLTDNRSRAILRSFDVPPWHVAVWVPDATILKTQVAAVPAASTLPLKQVVAPLADALTADRLPATMTENGRAFHRLYEKHGLPVDDRPARVALSAGALGAGLSGTGPAVAALFDAPVELPIVAGGSWTWTQAIGVTA